MKWVILMVLSVSFGCILNAQPTTFNIHYDGGLDQSLGGAGIEVNGSYWSVSRGFTVEDGLGYLSFENIDVDGNQLGTWWSVGFEDLTNMDHLNYLIEKDDKIYGAASSFEYWIIWEFDTIEKVFSIVHQENDAEQEIRNRIKSISVDPVTGNILIAAKVEQDGLTPVRSFLYELVDGLSIERPLKNLPIIFNVNDMSFLNNDNLLLSGSRFYYVNQVLSTQLKLVELDQQDSVIWSFETTENELLGFNYDMLVVDDKYIYIATHEVQSNISGLWRSYVMCINKKSDHIEWQRHIGPGIFTDDDFSWQRILMSPDSSGIIVAGANADSIEYTPNLKFREFGAMAKLSFEGDSIWYRSYNHLGGLNWFRDMESTSDGGLLLVGVTSYGYNPGPDTTWVNTWMLKTDGEGRLIPDTTSTVTYEQDDVDYHIRVYPNPTSDQLYIEHEQAEQYQYTLRDSQGRVTKEWYDEQSGGAVSYILDTHDYTSGVYFLSIYLEGEVVATQKVVIQ